MKTTIFSANDVRQIIAHLGIDRVMDEAIEALNNAFLEYQDVNYKTPVRDGFEYNYPDTGLIEWMPTMAKSNQVVIKIVGYHPSNPGKRQLPSVLSTGLSLDTVTGHLEGLMDCTFLTAIRTGAASAIASRILARKDASILGLIGCGAQSVTQLHALSRVFSLTEVLIFDVDEQASKSFEARISALGLGNIKVVEAPLNELVSRAHILCTTTSVGVEKGPVFDAKNINPELHVNAVGSDFPGKIEVPYSLLTKALVCPDFRQQAEKEGECQQLSGEQIGPDIATLVKNEKDYRHYREKPTVFDSTGWALEDYAMVNLLSAYGKSLGYGSEVQLACVGSDPKDPYSFIMGNETLSNSIKLG